MKFKKKNYLPREDKKEKEINLKFKSKSFQ